MQQVFNFLLNFRLAFPIILATSVGVGTGFIAVGFIKTIDWIYTLFFDPSGSLLPFRYLVIIIPALGGLIVGPLVTFLAPEAKGHGVPEVLKAIALRGGRIRPMVVVIKAVASALSIGTGFSVGREGPIVQVGSAFGSAIGQYFKLNEFKIKNFVACGAAAGISAVFNAPIAGVMFASEVILRDFGARSLSTVVVASVSSSIISRIFLGESPAFVSPTYALESPLEIFLYLILGLLCAVAAITFISVLSKTEDLFDRWKFPEWLKPAVGGLLLGVIGLFCPQIFGTGLSTIEQALHGDLGLYLLFSLIFVKIIATSLSLGAGSSGGVFAPALFIGAVLGGAFGNVFYGHLPFSTAPPGAYALVGMASVFAGAAHAPITALLIVFELTGDYKIILPIMIAVVISTLISQWFNKDSIYTKRLGQQGIDLGILHEAGVLGAMRVADAMSKDFQTIPSNLSGKDLVERISKAKNKTLFVTNAQKELIGQILPEEVQEALLQEQLDLIIAQDLTRPLSDYCHEDESLGEASRFMIDRGLTLLPVTDSSEPSKVIGLLKPNNIFRAYTDLSLRHADIVHQLEHKEFQARGTLQTHIMLDRSSPLVGKKIMEAKLPEGVVFTSIRRGSKPLIPKGSLILKARDKISVIYTQESKKAFKKWLSQQKL